MAEVDPDQYAALRRLRATFGYVKVLAVVDHDDGEQPAPTQAELFREDQPPDT